MMGGTIIAFIGGIHHWWPKMFGKMYNERWGVIGGILVFVGFNVTFFTQFFLGTRGMPRRYASYLEEFTLLHQVSTIGSWILLAGFVVHLLVFIQSLIAGSGPPILGRNVPEWEAESPPSEHNFHRAHRQARPYDFESAVPPHWEARTGRCPMAPPAKH